MKPIIIIPEETMTPDNIKELRDNGLCVVETKDPALVKFLDPIPAMAERTNIEDAAIQLSRKILSKDFWTQDTTRQNMAAQFIDILFKGTKLDPRPSQAEQEKAIFNEAKAEELRKLAREEAKTEREAMKKPKK